MDFECGPHIASHFRNITNPTHISPDVAIYPESNHLDALDYPISLLAACSSPSPPLCFDNPNPLARGSAMTVQPIDRRIAPSASAS